jgi:SWI/SNF-related matrix-associated actin-dependent regulator of chromatin subfamily A member 5
MCPSVSSEDCLPPGELHAVGATHPGFVVLGYAESNQAYWVRCADCVEYFTEHPEAAEAQDKEDEQARARARGELL